MCVCPNDNKCDTDIALSLSLTLSHVWRFFLFCFQLLTIFVSAKLAAYVKFYQNNKDFIDSLGKFLCPVRLTLQTLVIQGDNKGWDEPKPETHC